ncbi:ABC transporter ATP-binding protein [Marinomonas balearica]|uniref:ABC-type Fe3+/spermidine/putrescine transport system ATPase subunit n=1 Tax=Marinomonas balearica TaxID=491947 RepID=A0A4R6ME58_9GAMM|nr:ABC transporter ATP-binding protein [Marinomonas balearica]TDO98970.1 ABC-type Fe3+/spermidine/putrescine transport system ATPase subunit [Marinomonas balearica]
MTRLNIENLNAGYGNKQILNDISLTVEQGEMIALLGPSGCGKTTLLNALCGFVPVSGGKIKVGNRDITTLPAENRNITMVFQSYALWPHMTVAQNVGYGLKVQKVAREEIEERVHELLSIVRLAGLANDKVTTLSGGQRQRVALARALAIRPDVLVLDEPLSNLDAKVRLNVRHEIKALQKQLGFTSLIVTHDQEEALVMADRIAVLNKGQIEQLGRPEEIYQSPKTPFVANFMGAENQIVWTPELESSILTGNSEALFVSRPTNLTANQQVFFRSENVTLITNTSRFDNDNSVLSLRGHVMQSAFFGNNYRISVQCGEHIIQADHTCDLPANTPVLLSVPAHALHVYDIETSFKSNAYATIQTSTSFQTI